jgi:Domain of unknown function (DUF4389)
MSSPTIAANSQTGTNPPTHSVGLRAPQIIAIIIGAIFALVGIGSLFGAGALSWANATQRDSQGFFSTPKQRFSSPTSAITSDRIDFRTDPGPSEWFVKNDNIARLRIRAKNEGATFIGVGPEKDVERYLSGVAHDEVTRVKYAPFSAKYRNSPGTRQPLSPAGESFWVAKAVGEGTQTLQWIPTNGSWAVVIMNADGTSGVNTDVSFGLRVSIVGWIIGTLIIFGLVTLAIGTILILVFGARRSTGSTDSTGSTGSANSPTLSSSGPHTASGFTNVGGTSGQSVSPVRLEGHLTEPLSRSLWIVKWLLLIPHVIVLVFLWIAFGVLTFVAGVSILFTGRYPRSIFNFNVGVLRWSWRVQFYGPSAYGTDTYPPFTLERVAYPATLEIEYPERLSRGLVLVKWWLLALPHLVIVAIFSGGWSWTRSDGNVFWRSTQLGFPGGLIGVTTFIAGVVLLFKKKYPQGLFDFILGMNRWVYRVIAYVALMTDQYPPFHLDGGATEPLRNGSPSTSPSTSDAMPDIGDTNDTIDLSGSSEARDRAKDFAGSRG